MDLADACQAVRALRAALDEVLVGQEEAKQALLLGLLSRQHVLLEGAVGCGKTLLATRALRAAGAGDELRLVSFHRDIRREELLGEVVLRRSLCPADGGVAERLSFEVEPGALQVASLAVLDNIERAPGEALAPLLQLLGQRGASENQECGAAVPALETAVATLNPEREGGASDHCDSLEPSQLDRFALQATMRGLVTSRSWSGCREVLRRTMHGERALSKDQCAVWSPALRHRLQSYVSTIPMDESVRRTVALTLERLAARIRDLERTRGSSGALPGGGSAGAAALLSDRTFAVVLPDLMRAHALVAGRGGVAADDLAVLRMMSARRFPPAVHELLNELIAEASRPEEEPSEVGPVQEGEGLPLAMDGAQEASESSPDAAAGHVAGAPPTEAELPEAPPLPPRRRKPRPTDVEPLLRALEGKLDQGRSDLDDDPGGQPRGYRSLRRLDEILDADPLDMLLLANASLAGTPRVLRRRRRMLGGAVIVARDVSSSMAGFRNDWASELICGVIRSAARRRMRVGYLEFHQRAMPRPIGGRLLHRHYQQLARQVRDARPMGQTNYEAPLRLALDALRGRRGSNRHVVLLTDGLPILGDTQVRAERANAKRLGVSLHTVFIGDGESPGVLDDISLETGGVRFQAKEGGDRLVLFERGRPAGASAPAA